jgi:hypothetical protein
MENNKQSTYLILNQSGRYFAGVDASGKAKWSDNIGNAWIYRQYLIAFDVARQTGGRVIG